MFNLKSEITITPPADSSRKTVIYPFVTNVDIVSSFDNLTDKAVFSVPKSIKSTKDKDIYTLIEVGDKVEIKLNYDNFNTTRFKGYLSEITPSVRLIYQLIPPRPISLSRQAQKSMIDSSTGITPFGMESALVRYEMPLRSAISLISAIGRTEGEPPLF